MSTGKPSKLIAESEIKNALRIYRPDAAGFKSAVRQRLDAMRVELTEKEDSTRKNKSAEWLSTAAAVLPFPLLSKGSGTVLGKGVGANGPWGAKVVGWLAAGPLTLVLATGGFVLGFQRIRSAQRGPSAVNSDDPIAQHQVMSAWWIAYAAVYVAICVAVTVSLWYGHTMPMLIVFLFYGVAVVALATKLGKEQVIDRATLAAGLASALMLHGQLVSVVAQSSRGTFLLDQSLAAAIMCLGASIIALFGVAIVKRPTQRIAAAFPVLLLLFLASMYGSSALFPMTPQDVRTYVESTDVDRFGSATWRQWSIAAGWLRDTEQAFDPTKPRALFEQELAGKQNPLVMASAFRGGLVNLADAEEIAANETHRVSLVQPRSRDRGLPSIEQRAAEVFSLEQLGRLTPKDRSVLADRLIATINHAAEDDHGNLVEVLVATQMLKAIDHGDATKQVRKQVRGMIASFQRLEPQRLGSRAGGFSRYRTTDFGDGLATAVAVELMQTYGVPKDVDTLALRSYLRPNWTDWLNRQGAILRVVALWRFESLPDTPPLTWWDYIRCEQVIGMAFLAVLLSFTAVLGFRSPQSLPREPADEWKR